MEGYLSPFPFLSLSLIMTPFEVFEIIQQLIQVIYWVIRAMCHIFQVLIVVRIIKPRED